MGRTRALIAGALAVVYPGLGHLYLRAWFRAVAWFGLSLLTAALVVPPSVVAAYESGGLGALLDASGSLPTAAFLAILSVRFMNIVDAVWIGLRPAPGAEGQSGPTCHNCGNELDADLDFCHWCTARLDAGAEAEGGPL